MLPELETQESEPPAGEEPLQLDGEEADGETDGEEADGEATRRMCHTYTLLWALAGEGGEGGKHYLYLHVVIIK